MLALLKAAVEFANSHFKKYVLWHYLRTFKLPVCLGGRCDVNILKCHLDLAVLAL